MDNELSEIEGWGDLPYGRHSSMIRDGLVERALTLNLEKWLFSQTRLEYLGQIFDSQRIRKYSSKVKDITDLAVPQNVADLRRFLRMVNHLMKFGTNLAAKTKPVRHLLKKDNAWIWDTAQQDAFQQLKADMASDHALTLYDPEKETTISSDSFGPGAVLMQKQPSGKYGQWHTLADP